MKKLMMAVASAVAIGCSAFAADWFNAGISSYDSWPTDGSDKVIDGQGTWSNTDAAELGGESPSKYLTVEADVGSPLKFTADTATALANNAATITSTVEFTPFEELPAAPDAKAGVIVYDGFFYVFAKDAAAETNTWVKTEVAAGSGAKTISVTIKKDDGADTYKATYTIGETTLAALPVVITGEAEISTANYEGDGKVSALSGTTEALTVEFSFACPDGVSVDSVTNLAGAIASPYKAIPGSDVWVTYKTADGKLFANGSNLYTVKVQAAAGEYPASTCDQEVKDAEAKIGEMYYLTLQQAFNAGDNVEVELCKAVYVTNTALTVAANTRVTLDLAGNVLTAANTGLGHIQVNGTLIIEGYGEGGQIVSAYKGASGDNYGLIQLANAINDKPASFTLNDENVEIRSDYSYGIVLKGNESTVMIQDGSVVAVDMAIMNHGSKSTNTVILVGGGSVASSHDYAIYSATAGEVEITGGEVEGAAGAVCMKGGELTVTGGTLSYSGEGDTGTGVDGTTGASNSVIYIWPANANVTADLKVEAEYTGDPILTVVEVPGKTFTVTKDEALDIPAPEGYEWEDDTTLVKKDEGFMFQIGAKKYKTLGEALAEVNNGETITLLADITTVGITVNTGKTFTFDLGGHTYTVSKPGAGSTGTATQAFQFLAGQTVTISNGTINCGEDNLELAVAPAKNIKRFIQNYANLTIKDVAFDGANLYANPTGNAFIESANGSLAIVGSTSFTGFNANTVAINVDTWKDFYPAGTAVTIDTTGSVGTIYCYSEGTAASYTKSSLNLQNGQNIVLTVAEGDLEVDVTKSASLEFAAPAGYGWKDGTTLAKYVIENVEEEKKYFTVAEAIEAGKSTEGEPELKFLANVDVSATGITIPERTHDGKFTFDLNGKTVTAANTENGHIQINPGAGLEVKDSVGGGQIISGADGTYGLIQLCNAKTDDGASFTLESGTVKSAMSYGIVLKGQYSSVGIEGGTVEAYKMAIMNHGSKSDMTGITVKSGATVTSTHDYAIYGAWAGSINVYGKDTVVQGAAGAVLVKAGYLTVSSGTLKYTGGGDTGTGVDGTTGASNSVIYVWPANGNTTVNLQGGTYVNAPALTVVEVPGNTFTVTKASTVEIAAPDGYGWKNNTTLTKQWTVDYTVGEVAQPSETVYNNESPAAIPATPAKVGYTGAWDVDPNGAVITCNTNFTYTYTAIYYTVTAAEVEGGTIEVNKNSATMGETITVTTTPASGYKFVEGSITTNGTAIAGNTFVMPAENVTVSATFESAGPTPVSPDVPTEVKAQTEEEAKAAVQVGRPAGVDDNIVTATDYDAYFTKTATEKSAGTWTVTATLKEEIVKAADETAEVAAELTTFTDSFSIENAKPGLYYAIRQQNTLAGGASTTDPKLADANGDVTITGVTKWTDSGFYQVIVVAAPADIK